MSELKLNLGCGPVYMQGYVNIDGYPTEERGGSVSVADRHLMIEDLDYPQESVDHIICIHTLEHLTPKQVEKALINWYGCLKPRGTLIIEVPDAEAIMSRLLSARGHEDKDLYYYLLYGTQEFEAEHHRMGHTYERLERMLEPVGFVDCIDGKRSPRKIRDQKVVEMFWDRRWRAVLLQCSKPDPPKQPDVERLRRVLYFEYREQDLNSMVLRVQRQIRRYRTGARLRLRKFMGREQ